MKTFSIITVFTFLAVASASLSGPFLFWGHEKVEDIHLPALSETPDQTLKILFKEAKAVIIFIRNNTNLIDTKNYPKFKQLIRNNTWAFIQVQTLIAEPFDFNANIEVSYLSKRKKLYDLFVEGHQFEWNTIATR